VIRSKSGVEPRQGLKPNGRRSPGRGIGRAAALGAAALGFPAHCRDQRVQGLGNDCGHHDSIDVQRGGQKDQPLPTAWNDRAGARAESGQPLASRTRGPSTDRSRPPRRHPGLDGPFGLALNMVAGGGHAHSTVRCRCLRRCSAAASATRGRASQHARRGQRDWLCVRRGHGRRPLCLRRCAPGTRRLSGIVVPFMARSTAFWLGPL
jgi:hypothetical protein